MATVKEDLATVLENIQNNRQGLVNAIAQNEAQLANMKGQLSTFDSAIAALQVSISDPEVSAQVEVQAEMNARVPLTAPPAGPAEGDLPNAGTATSVGGGGDQTSLADASDANAPA